ncbi:MAG: sensor histidine kinase [Kineosporiaceae bacterium]
MRIRWRLALLGTVLATGTVVLFALLLVVLATLSAPRDQDEALEALAAAAARDYAPGGVSPALTVDLATSLDPAVLVTDRSAKVVYAQARIGDAPPPVPVSLVDDALARSVSRATVTLDGVEVRMVGRARADGVVVAVQQTAYLADQRRGLWWAVVVAAVFTALAGAVASWVVSGRALRPLRTLAATAGEIARTGDLSGRLEVPRSRDDVGALAREFNAMMDRLQHTQGWLTQSLEQQRRFVADASHELRTPLATIRANAGFLAERPDAAAVDRAEAVDDVRAESERMATLVDDLLVLARTDALPQPVRRPVDVAALAADVARLAGTSVAVCGPRGPDAAAGGGTVVLGDEEMLRRLVRCLVDNATLHGMSPGGVEVRVEAVDGDWVVLQVRDHGSGFPPDALGRVFDRFYRADPARSGRGSGLGLAIARSVARLHGGDVVAANAPDGGAVLTVHLPAG